MIEANKAQLVMLREEGLLSPELAGRIAREMSEIIAEESAPGAERSSRYMALERRLIERIDHQATNLHLGRSNNDLDATVNRMAFREQILRLITHIADLRAMVQEMASENVDTIMPGYTHAVQAQPTSLAHILLAFDAALERDAERLQEAYARTNRSPLGSAAFTTSGFPLDRERLAELLGFPALVENSYDATMVSIADSKVELASALSLSALNIGRFAQLLLFQYDDPSPGLLLTGSITGRSSIMPQKRNPSALERLRLTASEVVGFGMVSTVMVHNTPMYEVKDAREDHAPRILRIADAAADMYARTLEILASLTVRKDILRALVDSDFSTMTELADTLHREAGIPFRTGHHVASELTTYGRTHGKTPPEITWEEVNRIYSDITGETLPLDRSELQRVFDPAEVVKNRKGTGGPQPESIARMLKQQGAELNELREWTKDERTRLQEAANKLEAAFTRLAN